MDNLKGKYLAFVIDPASQLELRDRFRPAFSKVLCHHVTVEFNLTEDSAERLMEELKGAQVTVVGRCLGHGVEALVVTVNDNPRRPDGKLYHITLSLAPGHKPVESNDLLQKSGYQTCIPIDISTDLVLLNK